MRAYAIVRKPPPGLHEHVIKLTKEEPKISIDGISENRLASPHKTGASFAHELHNSGAFFKFSNELEKQSNRSNHPEPPKREEPVAARIEPQLVSQIEQPPRAARTKKLFQEFPASPVKQREEESRQEKLNATPVRLLQPEVEPAVLPIESIMEGHHRKVKIFDHSEHSGVEYSDNIVYEAESKSVFCCGEISVQSNKQSEQPEQLPPMVFTKLPLQPETEARHESSKKRRIFEQFEQKDRVVEEFTFKDHPQSSRNIEREGDRSIRIKIFQFAPLPPFDI